ncbi:MAG: PepSY-associated TM helix domain-containing protein [Azospirillaceae bacterium]|nr:PepSY-associated TM helix domain-containing protein [Azospirillaceae bacterium]
MTAAAVDDGASRAMTAAALRRWRWVHKWSSLVCTLFLLLLCLSGLPLIFSAELDDLLSPLARPAFTPADRDLGLDASLAQGLALHPGTVPMSLTWPAGQDHTLYLWSAPRAQALPGEFHMTVIDLRDGKVVAEPPIGRRTTDIIHNLHAQLFAGLPGSLLLCAMGVLFTAAIVSGVVLYAPFMRRMAFGTVRTDGARRTWRLDLHNLLGIVVLVWTLVVGVSGVANTLAQPLFRLWQIDQLTAMIMPWHGKPIPDQVVSVGAAVAAAQHALPDAQPESVAYPYSRFGSPHHYIVWMRGDSPLTARLETPVLVDAATGAVAEVRALPWYLRALEVSRPLHFGDYGGMPLKLLWAAFDLATIAVLVTGLMLWVRPKRG